MTNSWVIIMEKTTSQFIQELKTLMCQPLCLSESESYLDIAVHKKIFPNMLLADEHYPPPNNPLIQVQAKILQTMQHGPFEYTRLGVNELLKAYLKNVSIEQEDACTRLYLECVYQLYLYSLLGSYPYTELFWDYLNLCFDSVSKFLIEYMCVEACQEFLFKVSLMGKKAAEKNFPTGTIQHSFHNIEIWARSKGFAELADKAKNYRFNLEII